MVEINRALAKKVLEVVDAGLSSGMGAREPGQMCVEAAVCYAMGLPHSDDPGCVDQAVRALKIKLNDCAWSSKASRAKGMRRLAIAQLGTKDTLDSREFVKRVTEFNIRVMVPIALRAALSIHPLEANRIELENAAVACEQHGTAARTARTAADTAARTARTAARTAAYTAARTARTARTAAYTAYTADTAARTAAYTAYTAARTARTAADTAAYTADTAAYTAYTAARTARTAADTAAYTADTARTAADTAARTAAYTARTAADTAADTARDKTLAIFAEGVVTILTGMKAPGSKFLDLTEKPE